MKRRFKVVAVAFAVIDTQTHMRVLGPFDGKDCKRVAEQARDREELKRAKRERGAR